MANSPSAILCGGALLLIEHFVGPSPVHGLGVFSAQFVPLGAKVWEFNSIIDRLISLDDINSLPVHVVTQIQRHAEYFEARGAFRLPADGAYYMNHSNNPNLDDQGDEMVAKRDIFPGDELFCDYRITKVWAFDPDTSSPNIAKFATNQQ